MRPPASIRFVDSIAAARARNASDLHLGAGLPPVLRLDGDLERMSETALTAADVRDIAGTVLSAEESSRLEIAGDVTTVHADPDYGRMRVHVYTSQRDLTIAIRLLDRAIPSLQALNLPPVLASFAESKHGIVMLAGPTGSGKTSTMAALVERINADSARRILTIEDPIEYYHESRRSIVTQREIGRNTPNLAAALCGALRADPDVIVVGELRDAETMAAALTAAETGHLVITTLHTGNAAQTVDRIVDSFSGSARAQVRAQLAQVLIAVACQHLVRRAAGHGRRAVVEVLVATDAVRNLVRDSKSHHLKNVMATGRRFGMQTLEQHAAELVADGEIDVAEGQRFGGYDACRTVA
ncbi:MAG: PilT/PilU family type 4a pilus ATPase [Candidatus Tumulicola sp.]